MSKVVRLHGMTLDEAKAVLREEVANYLCDYCSGPLYAVGLNHCGFGVQPAGYHCKACSNFDRPHWGDLLKPDRLGEACSVVLKALEASPCS